MFKIIGIILLGVVIGLLFRSKIKPVIVSKIMTYIIYLLLLILGVAVGANEKIISNLGVLGYKALIITMGSVLCSVIIALLIYNRMYKKSANQ